MRQLLKKYKIIKIIFFKALIFPQIQNTWVKFLNKSYKLEIVSILRWIPFCSRKFAHKILILVIQKIYLLLISPFFFHFYWWNFFFPYKQSCSIPKNFNILKDGLTEVMNNNNNKKKQEEILIINFIAYEALTCSKENKGEFSFVVKIPFHYFTGE